MSYATDPLDGVRHAGIYAANILNGAKPGDLPRRAGEQVTVGKNGTASILKAGRQEHTYAAGDIHFARSSWVEGQPSHDGTAKIGNLGTVL